MKKQVMEKGKVYNIKCGEWHCISMPENGKVAVIENNGTGEKIRNTITLRRIKMFDLKGKKALVTGSTQGIGLAIAEVLSNAGVTVFINGAISEEKVLEVCKRIPGSKPAKCDLSLPGCADKLYEITGDVDILILNASIQFRTPWDQIPEEEFDKQLTVNFKSSFQLMQKYVTYMKEQKWGRIITIGSVQQKVPHKDMAIYASLKSAQVNLVKNLAVQLAPFGITINNVAPGVITTPRNEVALSDKEYAEKVLSSIPCGYTGEGKDCAYQVLLLASDEGRYITGEDIFIDGGMSL